MYEYCLYNPYIDSNRSISFAQYSKTFKITWVWIMADLI